MLCEGVGGVQGAITLFCGGVAQTCHDDRVVELKEQLVVEEVDGEGQKGKVKEEGRGRTKESAPWMVWRWLDSELEPMRCEMTSSGVEECALCVSSMHDVHHAIVEVNIVIGVVLGELHVVVRVHIPLVVVCDDAVIDLTLGLIALVVIVVFVVAIFHGILLYGRYTLYTPPVVGDSELLLAVTEF